MKKGVLTSCEVKDLLNGKVLNENIQAYNLTSIDAAVCRRTQNIDLKSRHSAKKNGFQLRISARLIIFFGGGAINYSSASD